MAAYELLDCLHLPRNGCELFLSFLGEDLWCKGISLDFISWNSWLLHSYETLTVCKTRLQLWESSDGSEGSLKGIGSVHEILPPLLSRKKKVLVYCHLTDVTASVNWLLVILSYPYASHQLPPRLVWHYQWSQRLRHRKSETEIGSRWAWIQLQKNLDLTLEITLCFHRKLQPAVCSVLLYAGLCFSHAFPTFKWIVVQWDVTSFLALNSSFRGKYNGISDPLWHNKGPHFKPVCLSTNSMKSGPSKRSERWTFSFLGSSVTGQRKKKHW